MGLLFLCSPLTIHAYALVPAQKTPLDIYGQYSFGGKIVFKIFSFSVVDSCIEVCMWVGWGIYVENVFVLEQYGRLTYAVGLRKGSNVITIKGLLHNLIT